MFRISKFGFRIYSSVLVVFLSILVSIDGQIASAGRMTTGQELAQRVYDRENGDDIAADMQMILINKKENKRMRDFVFYSKDFGDRIKQINRFTSPADIKGTGFLSVEIGDGETEQFLYLPSLRRTRRIVSSQKSRSYVNSDFSYEDMERRPVEQFEHRISGQETVGNIICDILESKPKAGVESQYGLIKSRVDTRTFVPLFIEYFNKKKQLIKKYRVLKLEKIQDIWTEMEVIMEDLDRKHQTILRVKKIAYNTGLDDRIFTRQYLESE